MSRSIYWRLVPGLLALTVAGCAMSPPGPVPIEDRARDEASPKPVAATQAPLNREKIDSAQPKIYALPDPTVGVPAVAPPVLLPAPDLGDVPVTQPNLAVTELIAKADAASASGDRGGARAILERALKFRSNDGQIWYRLAVLNLEESEFEQAIVAADRAGSLAGDDGALAARAEELIIRARSRLNR